jgi:hypothetical protein
MSIRNLAALFFLIYGASIPILADVFVEENPMASLAMMGSCLLIAAMLWIGRVVLLNIMIAMYVFRIYLVKPYAGIFMHQLQGRQLAYIESLHLYFNSQDATVVYFSLFSLLLAWTLGLFIVKPRREGQASKPWWVFREIDRIVWDARWAFWFVWLLLFLLNYKSAPESWQGIVSKEGSPSFALGLLRIATLEITCLYAFIRSRQHGFSKATIMLLIPALVAGVYGSSGGGRGAIFYMVTWAFTYWLFLNYSKRLKIHQLLKLTTLALIVVPIMVLGGLFAQSLRPLLRSGADTETVNAAVLHNLDLLDPNNVVVNSFYFGVSELLHRLNNLQQSFLILNERFVYQPWDHFNPVVTVMRTVNDLVPGEVFSGLLSINQIFRYIYQGSLVTYSSDMWSIQGTLYLYFGFWFSPIVVFCLACFVAYNYPKLASVAKVSPSFAAVFIMLFDDLIENGTLERIIPVDIVRPLTSLLAIVFLVKLIQCFKPVPQVRKRGKLSEVTYVQQ